MTVSAESNPGKRNYTWEYTISNEIIATGDSIAVTDKIIGNQSLKAVVCNTMPLASPRTVCSDFTVNVIVTSKCVSIIVIFDAECFEQQCKTFKVPQVLVQLLIVVLSMSVPSVLLGEDIYYNLLSNMLV